MARCNKCGREFSSGICSCQTEQGSWAQFGQPVVPQQQVSVQNQQLGQGNAFGAVPQFGQPPQQIGFGQPPQQTGFGQSQQSGFGVQQTVQQFGEDFHGMQALNDISPKFVLATRVVSCAMALLCLLALVFNVMDMVKVIFFARFVSFMNDMAQVYGHATTAYMHALPFSVVIRYAVMLVVDISGIVLGVVGFINAVKRNKDGLILMGSSAIFVLNLGLFLWSIGIKDLWTGFEGAVYTDLQYFAVIGIVSLSCAFVAFKKRVR